MYDKEGLDIDIEPTIKALRQKIEEGEPLNAISPIFKELEHEGRLHDTYRRLHPSKTILNHAILHKRVDLIPFLVNGNPAIKNAHGMNALMLALDHYHGSWDAQRHEHFSIISSLLVKDKKILRIRRWSHRGETALHFVASFRLFPLFILLVSQGADLHQKNFYWESPLQRLQKDFQKNGLTIPSAKEVKDMADKMFERELAVYFRVKTEEMISQHARLN